MPAGLDVDEGRLKFSHEVFLSSDNDLFCLLAFSSTGIQRMQMYQSWMEWGSLRNVQTCSYHSGVRFQTLTPDPHRFGRMLDWIPPHTSYLAYCAYAVTFPNFAKDLVYYLNLSTE